MSLPIKIDDNITLTKGRPEEKGLVVKLNHDLYLIFQKRTIHGKEDYGFYLVNPWTQEGSRKQWGLTAPQCSRFIGRLFKNPSYGFGKTKENIKDKLKTIINHIKNTYVKHKLQKSSSNSKRNSKRQSKNAVNRKKTNKNFSSKHR